MSGFWIEGGEALVQIWACFTPPWDSKVNTAAFRNCLWCFCFGHGILAKCPVPASLYPILKCWLMLDGSRQMTPSLVWAVCHRASAQEKNPSSLLYHKHWQLVLAEAGICCCKSLGLFCRPWFLAEAKVKFYAPCHARAKQSPSEMCDSRTPPRMWKRHAPDCGIVWL